MMKTTTIDAVKQYPDLEGAGTMLDSSKHRDIAVGQCMDETSDSHERVKLPKIQVIVGTKSMEAGINGTSLKFAKCNGFPSSFYELVQQLGRVDRKGNAEPGSN